MTPVKPRLPAAAADPDSTTDASRRKWLAGTARAVAGAGLLSLVDPLVRAGADLMHNNTRMRQTPLRPPQREGQVLNEDEVPPTP